MKDIPKKIELATNLSIICVAILISVVLINKFWLNKTMAEISEMPRPEINSVLALEGVRWNEHPQTLVLVLNKDCKFCTKSADFYKRLSEKAKVNGNTKLLAVFPHSGEDGRKYLTELGVSISDVRQADLELLKVSGTPCLILVDSQGKIKNFWSGMLPKQNEEEVFAAL